MAAAELADEALRSFQPRLLEGGISIEVDTSKELPFVRADQRAMVLALRNLIDNAIRHVRNNGHIRLSVRYGDISARTSALERSTSPSRGYTESSKSIIITRSSSARHTATATA